MLKSTKHRKHENETMKSSEFNKLFDEAMAKRGIPVSRANATPEELNTTIFLFPPKRKTSAPNDPAAPSKKPQNEREA